MIKKTINTGLKGIIDEIFVFMKNNPSITEGLTVGKGFKLIHSILDMEVTKDTVLVGLYFPIIKRYHAIIFSKFSTNIEFNERRLELIEFIAYCLNDKNIILLDNNLKELTNFAVSEKIEEFGKHMLENDPNNLNTVSHWISNQWDEAFVNDFKKSFDFLVSPMLITFNGDGFDLKILWHILFYHNSWVLKKTKATKGFSKTGYQNFENNYTEFSSINLNLEDENIDLFFDKCDAVMDFIFKDNEESTIDPQNKENSEENNTNEANKIDRRVKPKTTYFKNPGIELEGLPFRMQKSLLHFDLLRNMPKKDGKSNALYFQKIEIFYEQFNSLKNGSIETLMIPIENINVLTGSHPKKTPDLNFYTLYNFNDVYYTYLLFLKDSFQDHLKSRIMFFEKLSLKTYNFSFSLNQNDPQMGSAYIKQQIKNYEPISKKLNKNTAIIKKEDLVLLNNYELAKSVYFERIKDLDYNSKSNTINAEPITIANTLINLSKGGLHSTGFETASDNPMDYQSVTNTNIAKNVTKAKLVFKENDYLIYDLDVKSFYVVICLAIFKQVGDIEKYNFFKNISDIRNKLKSEKNPLQLIYKIIILSITGQFNQKTAHVFDPLMYYSMTANGQLILLEFLLRLDVQHLLTEIIAANTDGVTIKIRKSHQKHFLNFVEEFEKEFDLEFDTKDLIEQAIILNVNKYVFIYSDSNKKAKTKGFIRGNFDIIKTFLVQFCKDMKFDNLSYDFIFETFNKIYDTSFQESKFPNQLIGQRSYQEKKVFYFSNNPESFAGIKIGSNMFFRDITGKSGGVFPMKEFNFFKSFVKKINHNLELKNSIIEEIMLEYKQDFNKASYFKLIISDLSDLLDNTEFTFKQLSEPNKNSFNELLSSYPVINAMQHFQKENAFITVKNLNKKTLKGWSKIDSLQKIQKYILENIDLIFQKAAAISLDLKNTFESSQIVIFDVDHPAILLNPNNLVINDKLLIFLSNLIQNQSLIVSSPTKQQMDRFKIILKIECKDPNYKKYLKNYESFKTFFKPLSENTNLKFLLEENATVCGQNSFCFDVKIRNPNYEFIPKVFIIDIKELENIFQKKTKFNKLNLDNFLIDLLKIREIPPEMFDKLYNEASSKKEFTVRDYSDDIDPVYLLSLKEKLNEHYKCVNLKHEKFLEKIYLNDGSLILNENLFILTNETLESSPLIIHKLLDFLKQNRNISFLRKNEDVEMSNTERMEVLKMEVFNNIIKSTEKEIFKSDQTFTFHKRNFRLTKAIWEIINEIVIECNKKYNTGFKFEKVELKEDSKENSPKISNQEELLTLIGKNGIEVSKVEFSSFCIFDKDPPNDRQVALWFQFNGCSILCFHKKCKIEGKYIPIKNELSSEFVVTLLINLQEPFIELDISIHDFFEKTQKELDDLIN